MKQPNMTRRELLLATTAGATGAIGGIGTASGRQTTTQSSADCVPSNGDDIEAEAVERNGIEIEWHRLQIDEYETYIEGKFRNANNYDFGYTEVAAEFFDDEGTRFSSNSVTLHDDLRAHRAQLFKLPLGGQGEVSKYKLVITGTED